MTLQFPSAEAALFWACRRNARQFADARPEAVFEAIDQLVDRGALTQAHVAALLNFGARGHAPPHATNWHRLWFGAISTLTPALQRADVVAETAHTAGETRRAERMMA